MTSNEQWGEITDEVAAQLHHRSVLGEALSETERDTLQRWYEMQDRLEAEQLDLPIRRRSVSELEQRIKNIIQQLSETIRLNNEVAAHNSAMLSEIVAMQSALPSQPTVGVAR